MRQTVFAALLATALAGNLHDRSYYEEKFYNWLQEHKVEVRSGEHFVQMLANFAANDDHIHAHNAGNSSYTLGHNQFSHMNEEEWRTYLQGARRPVTPMGSELHSAPADLTIPTSIDWVAKGGVTAVKNQGQCGSCWTFSTTGAIEGGYFNKYGVLKSFSEQDLVDCDTALGNNGCNGGWMDNAFTWIKKNGGIPTEADYPYVSGTTQKAGTCDKTKDAKKDPKSAPLGYKDIAYTAGQTSDNNFVSALALQPLSVAIEAGGKDFQLYTSGVFTGKCGATLDHGVLAVGYDSTSYKVKNSWGPTWGEGGYIRLGRGASYNNGAGQCGVLSAASYPTF